MNRREFLWISAVAATTGCHSLNQGGASDPAPQRRVVDAGPAANYAKEGVYSAFRTSGFFLVRRGERLFAVSSWCTHKKCPLAAEPDHTFYCKCHGSTFAPDGKVTHGPAKRDLPTTLVVTNEAGHLLVEVPHL